MPMPDTPTGHELLRDVARVEASQEQDRTELRNDRCAWPGAGPCLLGGSRDDEWCRAEIYGLGAGEPGPLTSGGDGRGVTALGLLDAQIANDFGRPPHASLLR